MYCKQCGKQLEDDAVFCTNCGAKQNASFDMPVQNEEVDLEKTVGMFDAMPSMQTSQPIPNQMDQQQFNEQQFNQQPVYQSPVQEQQNYSYNYGEVHNGKVGFGKALSLYYKNCFKFRGRASVSEFTWVFFFNFFMSGGASELLLTFPPLGAIMYLALIIPMPALIARRLHDVGKPGVWYLMFLIPIVGIFIVAVKLFSRSDGDNKYGPGPVNYK